MAKHRKSRKTHKGIKRTHSRARRGHSRRSRRGLGEDLISTQKYGRSQRGKLIYASAEGVRQKRASGAAASKCKKEAAHKVGYKAVASYVRCRRAGAAARKASRAAAQKAAAGVTTHPPVVVENQRVGRIRLKCKTFKSSGKTACCGGTV